LPLANKKALTPLLSARTKATLPLVVQRIILVRHCLLGCVGVGGTYRKGELGRVFVPGGVGQGRRDPEKCDDNSRVYVAYIGGV